MAERNFCPNPAAANNLTNYPAGVGGTLARITLTGWERDTGIQIVTSSTAMGYTEARFPPYVSATSLGGQAWSASAQWFAYNHGAATMSVFLVFLDAAGTGLLGFQQATPTIIAGAVHTTVTGTAPANTRQVALWLRLNSAPINSLIQATAARYDQTATTPLPYGDGATSGWSWDGTAGNSTSTGPADPVASPWPWLLDLVNQPPTPAPIRHDLAGDPDGPLTVADTGQPYTTTVSGAGAVHPVVRSGAIGTPAGWSPPSSGVAAWYAHLPLPAPCTWVGAMLRFDTANTSSDDASCCIGAFNHPGYQEGTTNAPIHLSIAPTFFQFSVFTGGVGDYTTLTPVGGGSGTVALSPALPCDSVTETRCDVWIDRAVGRAWVTIGNRPVWVFENSRITQAAAWPFWEGYIPAGHTNLPRFTRVWAGSS